MTQQKTTRRGFLKTTTTAAAAAGVMPYWFTSESAQAFPFKAPSERPVVGCIGTGSRWGAVGPNALKFGDCVAVCDVDANRKNQAREKVKGIQSKRGFSGDVTTHEDYRAILDNKEIEVVTIVTTDHWHSKIAIEAMQAGKDVYCEKPLTLTIKEGKQIIKVLKETNRVFQVGTQQRSEMGSRFLQAIAMIRDGRIGDVKSVVCNIGGSTDSGPIPKAPVPTGLNWEKWLGQAPLADYYFKEGGRWGKTNGHYEFRWWYEYSGGKMTDWGAHHVDIAQWAIGMDNAGPVSVSGTAEHPVDLENGMPVQKDRYNAAVKFDVDVKFPNGVDMKIVSDSSDGNGILFTGTKGRFHVSRGRTKGAPFDALKNNPLPDGAIEAVYGGKKPGDHMGNFMECVKTRELPISDVYTHHRAMTTCHLANIAIRLGRKINWDYETEQVVGDADANLWQSREQRKGYEIEIPV